MTRLLRTTACALVSSFLLLAPATSTHHDKNNNNNNLVAGADDHHGHKRRNFDVREVRFSPFVVHDSTELVSALVYLFGFELSCVFGLWFVPLTLAVLVDGSIYLSTHTSSHLPPFPTTTKTNNTEPRPGHP